MGGESAAAFMIMNRSLSKKGWCVVVLIMTLYAQVAMGHSDMDSCKSDVSTATENVLQSLKVSIMGTMGGPKMWSYRSMLHVLCSCGCAQSAEEAPNDSSYFVEDHVVFKVLGLLRMQEFYLLTSAQIFFIPQDFETTIE